MSSHKPIANTVVLDNTHVQASESRFQRLYNSNTTDIANVEIGSNSTNVVSTTLLPPGASFNLELPSHTYYLSLNTNVATVYRTPISGGD